MAEGTQFKNITETSLIKQGPGYVKGILVNNHNAGTLVLYDGLTAGVTASGKITSSGACVPASHATSKLTTNAPVAGNYVKIGGITYTAVLAFTGSTPYQVKYTAGATAGATFLDNLKLAVNGTGVAGVNYSFGTLPHPDVVATTNTDTTQVFVARLPGLAANTISTTATATRFTWEDTTFGGGTGDSNPGVTTGGATITIGDNTYTAVTELSETAGAASVANQVLWVTSEAVFLDNLKSAINRTGTPGTDYSTETEAHPQVIATTNTNTEQTVVAKVGGTAGNSIATTETLANYAWGAATLASGTLTSNRKITGTITFSAVATTGERFIPTYDAAFTTGLLAVVGGTAADLTILYN